MGSRLDKLFAKQIIVAKHKRNGGCGKVVAVYAEGIGWRWERRCRCSPLPELPAGDELAALLVAAEEMGRRTPLAAEWTERAPLQIPV